jgi:hypothetical protein
LVVPVVLAPITPAHKTPLFGGQSSKADEEDDWRALALFLDYYTALVEYPFYR